MQQQYLYCSSFHSGVNILKKILKCLTYLWWAILGSNQWPLACRASALDNWANRPKYLNDGMTLNLPPKSLVISYLGRNMLSDRHFIVKQKWLQFLKLSTRTFSILIKCERSGAVYIYAFAFSTQQKKKGGKANGRADLLSCLHYMVISEDNIGLFVIQ